MSEETTATEELDELLQRLQRAQRSLVRAINAMRPQSFHNTARDGDSVKSILERLVNEVNFYYGRMVAQALSLPQPPGLGPAEFDSLEDAKSGFQAAHRGMSRLLHDLKPHDLERKTRLESTTEYTLRQVLETAVAHYKLRADQLNKAIGDRKKGGLQ